MKYWMIFIVVLFMSEGAFSQNQNKAIFLSLQPGITVEKFYDDGDFDINILPITIEARMTPRLNIRATSIVNYFIGDDSGISDVGVQLLSPIYIKKMTTHEASHGVYVAPLVSLTKNLIRKHNTYIVGLEPGFMFKNEKAFTLSVGIQLGGSYFDFETDENEWINHFGVKVNLGFWINRKSPGNN